MSRILHIIMLGFVLGAGIFGTTLTQAAILYVDNARSCPGNGSSSTPYCSIQNAMNAVVAGDTIRIRTGTGVYSETASVSGKNGTATNPIVIEPDSGANFVIRNTSTGSAVASIQIKESDYWTIRNLVFDAQGVNPSYYALKTQCETKNCVGWLIQNNQFKNWTSLSNASFGPVPLYIAGCDTGLGCPQNRTWTGIIEGNTFQNNDLYAIQPLRTSNTVIRNNVFTGQRCGREGDGAANNIGIHAIYSNVGMEIYGNRFSDFISKGNCHTTNTPGHATTAAIWCDVGGGNAFDSQSKIYNNVIYNIDSGDNSSNFPGGLSHRSQGIFIEAGCAGWQVYRNVIYNVGNFGIRNSQHSLNQSQPPNLYYHNTIYNIAGTGFLQLEGKATLKNNIFKNSGEAAVGVWTPSLQALDSNYNLYDDGGSQTKIGQWGGNRTGIGSWRTNCNCDAKSITGDPLFVGLTIPDFHLQAVSPARGAGEGGVDLGAFPYIPNIGSGIPTPPSNLLASP